MEEALETIVDQSHASANYDALLEQLDATEKEIVYLMKATQATVFELSKLPDQCDYTLLSSLSQLYLQLVESIEDKLKEQKRVLQVPKSQAISQDREQARIINEMSDDHK
jgi:hypothetical protein